jgi:hypothetical protein
VRWIMGKKTLLIGLCLVFLVGCASTLTYNPVDKTITAKDYTITIDKDGNIKAAPNRWFTTKAISDIFGNLSPMAGTVIGK